MKKLVSICATLALISATLAGCDEKPVVNTHKPGNVVKPDVEDELLPERGDLIKYSPSAKTTFYYPIMVDCYEVTKYAGSFDSRCVPMKTRVLANLQGFTAEETIASYKEKTNKYGSSTELPRQNATGRFYVKKIDDRWWFVDPEGYLNFNRGMNSFHPSESTERQKTAYRNMYGSSTSIWLGSAAPTFRDLGFNSAGAWAPNSDIQSYNSSHADTPLLMCPSLHFLSTFISNNGKAYPNGNSSAQAALILDGKFADYCKTYARSQLSKYKDDPNVVGIFSDNEIQFINIGSGAENRMLPICLKTDGTIASAARAWCTANKINPDSSSQTGDWNINCSFGGYLAELYYKAVSEAIKEVDPKMLYFGSRLHGDPRNREEIWKAAGKYCDVISVNYYGDWSADLAPDGGLRAPGKNAEGRVAQWEQWSGKPCLVSEFYTKGIEDSDLANTNGAGLAVRNQAARAYAYQHFTLGLLEAPNVVGWHWFKYQDDDGSDDSSNKGLYDNNLKLYEYLARYMRNINIHVYDLITFFDEK